MTDAADLQEELAETRRVIELLVRVIETIPPPPQAHRRLRRPPELAAWLAKKDVAIRRARRILTGGR